MDGLISSLDNASISSELKIGSELQVYISEISSPTRVWVQFAVAEIDSLLARMR